MSNVSKNTSKPESLDACAQLPQWAIPITKVSDTIYPFFLIIATLCFVLVAAFIAIKHAELSWLINVIAFFGFFYSIGILAMLVANYNSLVAAWVGIVLGVILYFTQYFVSLLAHHVSLPLNSPSVTNLTSYCGQLGIYTITIAILSLVVIAVRRFMFHEATQRAIRYQYMDPTAKNTEKPGLVPKCWQMSRCRPSVRATCPNYIDHITCWKRRSGCFCDRDLANFLIGSVGRGEAQEVIEMQVAAGGPGTVHNAAKAAVHERMANKSNRRPWRAQKRLCHNCPLFVEHQEYKYKNFSWVRFAVTIAIVGTAYHYFDLGYHIGFSFLENLLITQLHVPGITQATSIASNSAFEYFLLGVLSLSLLSHVIGFMDKFFLKWKL
ncbi:MAG TPA: hypothetical protein VGL77_05885 [Armatimonadota bacterium]